MRPPGRYLSDVGLLMDVLAVAAFDPRESDRIIGLLERGLPGRPPTPRRSGAITRPSTA